MSVDVTPQTQVDEQTGYRVPWHSTETQARDVTTHKGYAPLNKKIYEHTEQ